MPITFRSERHRGRGRIAEVGLGEIRIEANGCPERGEAVRVILLGSDGVDQARILGVVCESDGSGFRVRSATSDGERGWIRKTLPEEDEHRTDQ